MKTIERTTQEYRTPKCKVVEVHYEGALLGPSFGEEGKAGGQGNWYDDPEEGDF